MEMFKMWKEPLLSSSGRSMGLLECERCHKEKRGVIAITVRGQLIRACRKCRVRISNIEELIQTEGRKSIHYNEYLEGLLWRVPPGQNEHDN